MRWERVDGDKTVSVKLIAELWLAGNCQKLKSGLWAMVV